MSEDVLTSIQHLGLPALVPHTIIVSFTFWMTVMKLSHSSCERKKRQWKQKMRQKTEGRRKKYTQIWREDYSFGGEESVVTEEKVAQRE